MSKIINHINSDCRLNLEDASREISDAISFMEGHPEKFAFTWHELFKHYPKGPFRPTDYMDYEDVPEQEDGVWKNRLYEMQASRDANGTEVVEFRSATRHDWDCDWDTDALYERKPRQRVDPYFIHDAMREHCRYRLLKMRAYEVWCCQHGEDPLSNVMAAHRDGYSKVEVTLRKDGTSSHLLRSKTKVYEQKCVDYIISKSGEPRDFKEVRACVKKNPKGRRFRDDTEMLGLPTFQWTPKRVSEEQITVIVEAKGRYPIPVSPARIRKISGRNLAKEVYSLVASVYKEAAK